MTDAIYGFTSFTVIIVAIALWFRAIKHVQIPENRALYILTWIVAGVLVGVNALLGSPGWIAGTLAEGVG